MKTEAKNGVNGTADKNTKIEAEKGTAKKDAKEFPQDKPTGNLHFEMPKKEAETEKAKPALNLEETLKLVEQLYRRRNQRDKLIETIENLEEFEIDQQETADETGNTYSDCVLTIEDDKGRKFKTKNPVIIATVSKHVNKMCIEKLAEIEAEIIIP